MAAAFDPWFGDHIDVGVDAAVARVGVADFEDLRGSVGFVDQVMAIWVAGFEGRAVGEAAGVRLNSLPRDER